MAKSSGSSQSASSVSQVHKRDEGTSAPLSQPVVFNAALIARVQTVLSALSFLAAFGIGCALHYKKVVKNGVAGYPHEWLPSVSATIGDWYPERNVFQILIALTAPPRFSILFLSYYLNRSASVLLFGTLRTIACGGWVYITSSDNGMAHDVMMIGYMVLNIPWMVGNILLSRGRGIRRRRTWIATSFFATIIPLVYFYIQHKVHRIPGAYSYYAIFEWALIFLDIFYDSVSEQELKEGGIYVTLGPLRHELSGQDKDTVMYYRTSANQATAGLGKVIDSGVEQRSDEALKGAQETAISSSSKSTFEAVPEKKAIAEAHASGWRSPLAFISDIYLSYIFWSIFTALIPTLFYFSVWELGIAGQEFALLSLLSPFFLAFPPLLLPFAAVPTLGSLLSSRKGQTLAYLAQFAALLAWLTKSPVVRLAIVTPSCCVMAAREVVLLSGLVRGEGTQSGKGPGYWGVASMLGFAMSSLSKHANHGNNPVWPFIDPSNGGYNKTGLVLALLALLEFATRSSPKRSLVTRATPTPSLAHGRPSYLTTFLSASVPLGGLLFSLHNLLSDPSSLVTASWTGWENGSPRGPLPHVHGAVTMVVMCSGLMLGIWGINYSEASGKFSTKGRKNPLLSVMWFALGCSGTYGMYKERNWAGYASSLVLAFVLTSVAPAIWVRVSHVVRNVGSVNEDGEGEDTAEKCAGQLAKVYASAMLVYILFNLASIFTAAYAFVPGGWIFRERTDAVLTAQMACLAFAFRWPGLSSLSLNRSSPQIVRISASARRYAHTTLGLFSVLSVLVTLYRLPMTPPKPHRSGPRMVRAAIWTVHFGINNEGHDSQRGIRDLVKDMELDIVGLLETDLHRTAFGHRDLTRVMVEELGFNVDVGPGPNSHTWGAVLLSKFPIINTTHHLLPSPGGELAPAIEAVLDIHGTEVVVVVSHNGQEEDPLDRELQSTEIARIMSSTTRPVIFLGYVVTKPHQPRPHPYDIMVKEGNVYDIDDEDSDRWCEYIFYRGLYRTAYARVSRGIITDTEMQIGQFVVPQYGTTATNEPRDARYLRSKKEGLPVDHWFPMEYYGNEQEGGKNGHFYHVFNTPLYFQLPDGAL